MRLRRQPYRRPPARTTGEMNMTPFIDVLLVLLVMLMLSIPAKFHSLEVLLPSGEIREQILAQNNVSIDAQDRLYWNGALLSRDDLGAQLAGAAAMDNQPLVRFQPEANASYDRSAKTIAMIKDAGIEKFAFVGNHEYRTFTR